MGIIPDWLKIEVGRMLSEGVSDAGIKACVEAMKLVPTEMGDLSYSAFTEYGRRPEEDNVVEGSVVHPITDEQHLLPEGK